MHYGSDCNGEPTNSPRVEGVTIGQRDHLSSIDIAEIRAFSGCSD
jgi:hypothetical protein